MSIIITGLEIPTSRPICVVIDAAGQARRYDLNNDKYADDKLFEAVPVPLHGRLIDADAFESIKYELPDGQKAFNRGFHSGVQYVQRLIMDAPTIIPAEENNDR